jgi:hypothetical protein
MQIASIEVSDRSDSTQVVDIINLTNGQVILAWNGNACYTAYDQVKGRVEVGATLVRVEDHENHRDEGFQVYTFA